MGSNTSLFTHDGNDHRLRINKAASGDTASIIFQSDFSGRAEIGLAGDERLWLKVSTDGTTFHTAMVLDEKTGAASFPATTCGMINLLINGEFTINQRLFSGGSLSSGVYGHDRWKAGSGGASYTVSAGTVSHASGPLTQVIERPGLAGRTVTLSVEELIGGNLNVTVEGQTGTIAAGTGRRGVTLAVPGGSTGNVTVTLEPASGSVSYRRVQINEGAEALAFERRHHAQELPLCQRYYQKTYNLDVAPGTASSSAGVVRVGNGGTSGSSTPARYTAALFWAFPVAMRTTPSVTVYSHAGTPGHVTEGTTDLAASATNTGQISTTALPASVTSNSTYYGHFTAEAEL